jgi:hypothetical protein
LLYSLPPGGSLLLEWNSHCRLEVEESVEPLRLQSGGTKDMLATRLVTLESTARNRAIRVHLGERLSAYYDCMERTPPPERLAELIERLAQRLEAQNSKAE